MISCAFLYIRYFTLSMLLLFRPYQLIGVKRKTDPSLLPCLLFGFTLSFCFTSTGNVSFEGFRFTEDSTQRFVSYQCMLAGLSSNQSPNQVVFVSYLPSLQPLSFTQSTTKNCKEGKLLIALFAPLIAVVLKVISRISVQRLWNIAHPGYSYV